MYTSARLLFAVGTAATVMLLTSVAFGQGTAPSAGETPAVLPEVVISATRTERSATDLPVSATVITREEIINSAGHSAEEVLRGIASVQLQPDNSDAVFPLQPSIAIRGIGVGDTATRALVLVDGIPINGGFFGNVFWNRIPKENLERIEIVRGASSSLYGSYAMGGVVNFVTRAPTQREGSVGVFGEVSLKPIDTVEILGNLRFDAFLDSDGRIVTDGVPQTVSDQTLTIVSPRIAARWQFSRPVALRTSFYEGFRVPTLAELYRSFESPTFRGLSNPNLNAERLLGGDLGLDVRVGRLSGQLNGFYNRVKNFVGSEEVGFINDKFTVRAANVAEIHSRGFELMASLQITDDLSFTTNYTFTDSKVVNGPLKGNDVEGAPQNVAGFWLYYRAPFGLTVNPLVRYVGKSFQDITNEAVQDAHWIFDIFGAFRVHKHVEIFVSGQNIFNEQYVADGFSGGLGAPQQFSGGVCVNF